jgi:carboxymethylenebutenolidase
MRRTAPGLLRLTSFLILFIALVVATRACADDMIVREVAVPSADSAIPVKLFSARAGSARPVVIILHGRQGIEPFSAAYTRYGTVIAAQGMDAYLVSYFRPDDAAVMTSRDLSARKALFARRFRYWSGLVRDVVSWGLEQKESSGKVGLIGFSYGGFLAVASAGADPRVSALVVFYGGIPAALKGEITRLPPLLALHGDADRGVPLAEGEALVETARAIGSPAELIVYPGAGHGFDFDPERADAKDARDHAVSFLRRLLQ